MKRIPIKAARQIADAYGYDQVMVYARKVGEGEHMTTYGVNKEHCSAIARVASFLQREIMGWTKNSETKSAQTPPTTREE